jgi:hypothetical protein
MVKTMSRRTTIQGRVLATLGLVCLLLGSPARGESKKAPPGPGFVDGTKLIDIVGDDAVVVEVSLGKSLLKMMSGSKDSDLGKKLGGLESIYALIVDLSDADAAGRARAEVREIESRLIDDGWERIARVKETDAEIKVLVLMHDEERIEGLVVMIFSVEDDEPVLVFANIAGLIDMKTLDDLGDELDLPGLDELDFGN